jgi:ABC-type amino acid transport substrate-binding protein
MKLRKIIGIVCVALLSFTTYGCAKHESKKLVIGVSPDYPPFAFEYRNELIGFDIDLVSAIAQRLNYGVEFKKMNFDELLPSLENKTVDLVVSSVTQTTERSEKFDFSHPYYSPTFALVFKREKLKEIHSINDISGVIGVEKNTTMSDYLERVLDHMVIDDHKNLNVGRDYGNYSSPATKTFLHKKSLFIKTSASTKSNENTDLSASESDENNNQVVKNDFQIKSYSRHFDLLNGLEKDEVSAIFVEILQAEVITQNNRDMAYIPMPYQDNKEYYYGIVFQKNSKLTGKFNKVLDEIDSEGKIDILRLRWFSGYGIYGDILKDN